jgi:hypothetical protein
LICNKEKSKIDWGKVAIIISKQNKPRNVSKEYSEILEGKPT